MRREIVAKAILQRINKTYEQTVIINDLQGEKVLGCWMLQPSLRIKEEEGERIEVEGSFDVNAWIGIEELSSTKCVIEKQNFQDKLTKPEISEEISEVKTYFRRKPSCDKAWVEKGKLYFLVQYSIVIEWIGDTKMYVEVMNDEIDEVVDVAINEEYI